MKKIFTISAFILSSTSLTVDADPSALSARDTTNIIVAQNRQNQTLEPDQNPTPQLNRDSEQKVTMKDLKQALTMKVVVTGNRSISTEAINAVIKPYLKNTITSAERNLIKKEIQKLYTDKGFPAPNVKIESAGFHMNVTVSEE